MRCLQRYVYAFPWIYAFYKNMLKIPGKRFLIFMSASVARMNMLGIIRKQQVPVCQNLRSLISQSLKLGGRRGTTYDVATIPFHPSLSSVALRESPNPFPVHSLILSSHLFFCLPLLLAPFTVPCRIVFTMPEDLEMWPYHLSFRFFTMVRRSSCTPIAFWILLRTSSFVTWSL